MSVCVQTQVQTADGRQVVVSTISVCHGSGYWYETLVFPARENGEAASWEALAAAVRYESGEAALAGHEAACAAWREKTAA